MFRRVVEVDSANQSSCSRGFERFVESALRVRVEIVTHNNHLFAVAITSFKQGDHLAAFVGCVNRGETVQPHGDDKATTYR